MGIILFSENDKSVVEEGGVLLVSMLKLLGSSSSADRSSGDTKAAFSSACDESTLTV